MDTNPNESERAGFGFQDGLPQHAWVSRAARETRGLTTTLMGVHSWFNPNSAVGEHARPGRGWPRPRGQPVARDAATDAWNFSGRAGFPRGRGTRRPGRARSRFNFGVWVQRHGFG